MRSLYPSIYKAALEMSYCNGGINMHRTESDHQEDMDKFMKSQSDEMNVLFPFFDSFLHGLSDEDLETVVDGEESERQAIMMKGPFKLDQFLNDVFEKVC